MSPPPPITTDQARKDRIDRNEMVTAFKTKSLISGFQFDLFYMLREVCAKETNPCCCCQDQREREREREMSNFEKLRERNAFNGVLRYNS